jgi:hypothetical protein
MKFARGELVEPYELGASTVQRFFKQLTVAERRAIAFAPPRRAIQGWTIS